MICSLIEDKFCHNSCPIYTGDGSVWDEFGQGTVARLIIRLCINTAKQTSHPSSRVIHNVIVYNETPEAV